MYISWVIIVLIVLYVIYSDNRRSKLAAAYIKLGDDTNRRNWETREAIRNLQDVAFELEMMASYPNNDSVKSRIEKLEEATEAIKALEKLEIMDCYDTYTGH